MGLNTLLRNREVSRIYRKTLDRETLFPPIDLEGIRNHAHCRDEAKLTNWKFHERLCPQAK